MKNELWPALPLEEWKDTYATLHRWTQIIGKIQLAQTPLVNHWWNVTFRVTARGLTTAVMRYKERSFGMEFDFINHQLIITCDDGTTKTMALAPRSVASFYRDVIEALRSVGIAVRIWPVPVEIQNPISFAEDTKNSAYNPDFANRSWRILLQTSKVLEAFRSRFIGKCSPVHFFWGSFDLAVTRFSGKLAPPREGADAMTREAYSHEVISHGFWPGTPGGVISAPAFYAYAAPEPPDFKNQTIRPSQAFYSDAMKEFFLPYEDVRKANSPEETLLDFFQSTYDAGANLAHWNRATLERPEATVREG